MASDGQELVPYGQATRLVVPSLRNIVEANKQRQISYRDDTVCLGEVLQVYSETSKSALQKNIDEYMQTLVDLRIKYINEVTMTGENTCDWGRRYEIAGNILPMTFERYKDAVKNANWKRKYYTGRFRDERQSTLGMSEAQKKSDRDMVIRIIFGRDYAEYHIFLWIFDGYDRTRHTMNLRGYLTYLEDSFPDIFKDLKGTGVDLPLDEKTREMHTYITGGTGSGKTELLKSLVFHDVSHGNAVVIIDPTGNFAGSVARWPEFAGEGAERLVYLNPSVLAGMAPVLNPLDAAHLNPTERSILANQLTDVLAQVGETDWTPQTETVASACFQVLVNRPNSTLRDLRLALVEPDRRTGKIPPIAEEIISLGKLHPNQEVADFFEFEFLSSQYVSSKGSLRAKLAHILRDSLFQSMTTGKSTVDLAKMIDERKVVIFDLGAWGDNDAAGAFGRMVIAQLGAIGMRRRTEFNKKHTPVFVYIDEIDVFMCKAVLLILSELRQHGMHLTAAQQTVGYKLSVNDKRQLLNNTAIKFASGGGAREMLQMMGAPPEAAMRLKAGEFVGQWGPSNEPFRLATRSDLLGKSRRMSDEELRETMLFQAKSYYAEIPDRFAAQQLPQPSLATYQRVRKI